MLPGPKVPPATSAAPSQSGKHCLLLPLASGSLRLAEGSWGQLWATTELS